MVGIVQGCVGATHNDQASFVVDCYTATKTRARTLVTGNHSLLRCPSTGRVNVKRGSHAVASENIRCACVWTLVDSNGNLPRKSDIIDIDMLGVAGIDDPNLPSPTYVVSNIPRHAIHLLTARSSNSQNWIGVDDQLHVGSKVITAASYEERDFIAEN